MITVSALQQTERQPRGPRLALAGPNERRIGERPVFAEPPIVALEGLDGVGKSTVARLLAELLGAEYVSTPLPALQPLRTAIEAAFASSPLALRLFHAANVIAASDRARANRVAGRATVLDRYWLSTLAYAAAAGETELPRELGELLVRPTQTVFLVAPLPVRCRRMGLRQRTTADDSMTLQPEQEARLLDAYRRAASSWCPGELTVLDVGELPAEAVARRILALLRHRAAAGRGAGRRRR